MSTHLPDRHAVKTLLGKVLLDAEGLERTLSRIAHEIIERNDDLDRLALVGIHTRGVPIAERLAALIEERSGEEVDARRRRHHLPPRRRGSRGREQPIVHATTLDFELRGMTVRPRRRRPLHRPHDPGRDRDPVRARPARPRPARRPRRPRPSRAADPPRLRRQEPADGPERADPGRARRDRRGRPDPPRRRARGGVMRHLLSIADLTRADVERILETAEALQDRGREAADAAGKARAQPLLRVLDADVVKLRARREAALGGHDVAEGGRLLGRQGRVAQGHRPDARAVRPARDRRSATRRSARPRSSRATRAPRS